MAVLNDRELAVRFLDTEVDDLGSSRTEFVVDFLSFQSIYCIDCDGIQNYTCKTISLPLNLFLVPPSGNKDTLNQWDRISVLRLLSKDSNYQWNSRQNRVAISSVLIHFLWSITSPPNESQKAPKIGSVWRCMDSCCCMRYLRQEFYLEGSRAHSVDIRAYRIHTTDSYREQE